MNEQEAWQQRLKLVRQKIPALFTLGRTVLYVGATPWRFQMGKELLAAGCEITLLEAFERNADYYRPHSWLKDVICGDVRNISEIAGERKWDIVVWWHGPEHVPKDELATVLADLEQVANKLVLLGCPWGINQQGIVGGNSYSVHQAHLETPDLAVLGYETATLGEKDNPGMWCHIMAWRFVNGSRATMGCVVYTAIFGEYDELQSPMIEDGIPHICFTDAALQVEGWDVQRVKRRFADPQFEARMYKLLPHQWFPDAGVSIWHDGNIQLAVLPERLVGLLGECDIASFHHPWRDCVYEEAQAIVRLDKAPVGPIREQVKRYRQMNYPEHQGLAYTSVIVRRHTSDIERLNNAWWGEVTRFTARDQMSFDYVCWKLGMKYAIIPDNYWDNRRIVWHEHNAVGSQDGASA